jgi:hypothetical protein
MVDQQKKGEDNQRRGEVSELAAITKMVAAGITVAEPTSKNCRYDCIVDDPRHDGLERAQIKTARYDTKTDSTSDSIQAFISKHSGNDYEKYNGDVIDVFLLYYHENDTLYRIEMSEDLPKTVISLRPGEIEQPLALDLGDSLAGRPDGVDVDADGVDSGGHQVLDHLRIGAGFATDTRLHAVLPAGLDDPRSVQSRFDGDSFHWFCHRRRPERRVVDRLQR